MTDDDEIEFFEETRVQVWGTKDGTVLYSVIRDFSDTDDDHEVVAYGEALSRDHANILVGAELRQMFP